MTIEATRVTNRSLPSPRRGLPSPVRRDAALPTPRREVALPSPSLRVEEVAERPQKAPSPVVLPAPVPMPSPNSRRPARRRADAGSLRLQERDYEMLDYLARYRYATDDHLQALTDSSYSAIKHRMSRLIGHNLVGSLTIRQGVTAYWTKRNGAALVDADVAHTDAPGSLSSLEHRFAVAWLGMQVETRQALQPRSGADVLTITEHEMQRRLFMLRRYEGHDNPWSEDALPGVVAGLPEHAHEFAQQWVIKGVGVPDHAPDLVLVTGDGAQRLAVEVELNLKPQGDYDRIMRQYLTSSYTHVRYYVDSRKPSIARFVQDAALRRGLSVEGTDQRVEGVCAVSIEVIDLGAWHSKITGRLR